MEIKVHSVIDDLDDSGLPSGEPEVNIISAPCSVFKDGGKTRICYREEGNSQAVDVTLVIEPEGTVSLSRRGSVVWDVRFTEGVSARTLYRVPPYSFDADIYTKKIRIDGQNGIMLNLLYSMNIGGQAKDVRMKITVKG